MINTNDFRTRSLFLDRKNVTVEDYWPIAIDIGYSGVKGFSPNSIFSFPSYAKNLGKNPTFYGEMDSAEVLYRDGESGDIWRVGRSAQQLIKERDTGDSQKELFGRDRYFSQMYKVILRTGLALGMQENHCGAYNGKTIFVQSGLPPAYLEEDKDFLINAIAGEHNFAIKTARSKKFIKPELCISKKKVGVMSQPEGTLMSVAMDDKGATIPEAKYYFQSSGIILDAGFETLDLFNIENRALSSKESFSELGMREVFERTGAKIKTKTNVVIRPSAMQNFLEKGSISIKKRDGMDFSSKIEPIAELLEEASQEVCREAVEKTMNVFSELLNYNYLILAGGTSAAWETYIRNYFSQIEGLSIVMGNANCPELDMIFSNVRGYYMYLINYLNKTRRL